MAPVRYTSPDEDSGRWLDFPFRDGDVVISTRSKSGTTWVQQICLSLVLGTPDLPPLSAVSPWVDWLVQPYDEVLARLEAQTHRRVVKTHTPLDGVVLDPRATYLVVARHPLDAAVSLYHQGENLDRRRIQELTGAPVVEPVEAPPPRPPLEEWLRRWIARDADPRASMDSLPGYLHHASDAWARRHEPNVHLVHYVDLLADLDGEMRRLARLLEIDVPDAVWPRLVEGASFAAMRSAAASRAPGASGVLKDPAAFFRRGTSGAAAEVLDPADLAAYDVRAAALAPPDLRAWLHR